MKMQLQMDDLIISGQMEEADISVGDPRIIIHHLVKSAYQFPKITMIQEISSNAKDANAEAGNAHIPVEIKVPNALDTNLVISDHGIGINPSRMNDIFKKIGNSTKRDDNKFDGAFGIGSKIPLAYTDQFTVKTITEEGSDLVCRVYAIVRRDDFSIKIMTLGDPRIINSSDDACDQHTGTSITIPVQARDVSEVRQGVIDKTEFWHVRPTITGANVDELKYPERKWFYTCDDFKFSLDDVHSYDDNTAVEAIINGVRYPVQSTRNGMAGVNYPYFRGKIFLNFKVGELQPALNREALQYDEKSIALLLERINSAVATIKKNISDIINKEPTYLSAWKKMNMFRNTGWTDQNGTWHGFKLSGQITVPATFKNPVTQSMEIPDNAPVTFMRFYYDHNGKIRDKGENHCTMDNFSNCIEKKIPIMYTEKKSICSGAVKHILNQDSGMKNVTSVVFRGVKADVEKFLTDNHLEEIIPLLINIEQAGYVRPKRGQATGTKIVNKWRSTGRYHGSMETCGIFDYNDAKDTGYYYVYDRTNGGDDRLAIGNGTFMNHREIYYVLTNLGFSDVYGVAPGNVKFINKKNWKPLSDIFKDPANKELYQKLMDYQEYLVRKENAGKSAFKLDAFDMIDTSKISAKSPMRKWIAAVNALPVADIPKGIFKVSGYEENIITYLINGKLIKSIHKDTTNHPIIAMYDAVIAAYPLVKFIPNKSEETIKHITDYINMCDKKSGIR